MPGIMPVAVRAAAATSENAIKRTRLVTRQELLRTDLRCSFMTWLPSKSPHVTYRLYNTV